MSADSCRLADSGFHSVKYPLERAADFAIPEKKVLKKPESALDFSEKAYRGGTERGTTCYLLVQSR